MARADLLHAAGGTRVGMDTAYCCLAECQCRATSAAGALRGGRASAIARCYAVEGELAYAPVIAWLRAEALRPALAALDTVWLTEVARLLPDLLLERTDLPPPTPVKEDWERQRLFEALARALLGTDGPLLLLLDDVQWCDREALAWVHYLLRFDPQARLRSLPLGHCCRRPSRVSLPCAWSNLAHEIGSLHWIRSVSAYLARAHLLQQELTQAEAILHAALLPDGAMQTIGQRLVWAARAELALARGNAGLALDITEQPIASAANLPGERIREHFLSQATAMLPRSPLPGKPLEG